MPTVPAPCPALPDVMQGGKTAAESLQQQQEEEGPLDEPVYGAASAAEEVEEEEAGPVFGPAPVPPQLVPYGPALPGEQSPSASAGSQPAPDEEAAEAGLAGEPPTAAAAAASSDGAKGAAPDIMKSEWAGWGRALPMLLQLLLLFSNSAASCLLCPYRRPAGPNHACLPVRLPALAFGPLPLLASPALHLRTGSDQHTLFPPRPHLLPIGRCCLQGRRRRGC